MVNPNPNVPPNQRVLIVSAESKWSTQIAALLAETIITAAITAADQVREMANQEIVMIEPIHFK